MEAQEKSKLTAKEVYLARVEQKRAEGLCDVKFFPGDTFNVSEEQVYEELNRLHDAPDLPDPEVLGPRSIKA